jgi:hypothetical protein
MADIRKHSATSNLIRVVLNGTDGNPKTGLTEASSGLIISTIADVESAVTRYRASSSEIETITTLGTFSAPSSSKCRFKEVDATNHPGLYEIQLANARFSVSNARRLIVTWSGASGLKADNYEVQLVQQDPYDAAWANFLASIDTIWRGSVTGSPTTTTFVDSTLTQPDTDWWKGRVIIFRSASTLLYQATVITGFNPATDTLTFTAVTTAPTTGDTYVIV